MEIGNLRRPITVASTVPFRNSHIKSLPYKRFPGRSTATSRHQVRTPAGNSHAQPDAEAAARFVDYYKLLGVCEDASGPDVKRAFRYLHKRCHPDIAGGMLGHEMGILLNEAYATLSDPRRRQHFDAARREALAFRDFSGTALSAWAGTEAESRAVFVDEGACIGCLKCAIESSNTFKVEMKHGKARAVTQWGDSEENIQLAVSVCPVSCIHWVDRSQLPELEHVMRKSMVETHGRPKGDPFQAAAAFSMKVREAKRGPSSPERPTDLPTSAVIAQIMERGRGGSSSLWHAITGVVGEQRRDQVLALAFQTGDQPWSRKVKPEAAQYLEQVAAARRAEQQDKARSVSSSGDALAAHFNDEYWERVETSERDIDRSPRQRPRGSSQQKARDAKAGIPPEVLKHYAELYEAENRRRQFHLMIISVFACFLIWGGGSHTGHQRMSSAECYQHGGGLCRLWLEN